MNPRDRVLIMIILPPPLLFPSMGRNKKLKKLLNLILRFCFNIVAKKKKMIFFHNNNNKNENETRGQREFTSSVFT